MTVDSASDAVCIGVNRWQARAGAAFLGLFAVIGTSLELASHSALGVALVLALIGTPAALCAVDALRRGPSLIIDADALREVGSGRVVRWADVQDAYVRRRQSIFQRVPRTCLDHGAR